MRNEKRSTPVHPYDRAFLRIEKQVLPLPDRHGMPGRTPPRHFFSLVGGQITLGSKAHVSKKTVAVGVNKHILALDITMNLWWLST